MVPVGRGQVGWIRVNVGVIGMATAGLITALKLTAEVQLAEFTTVNVYDAPGVRPEKTPVDPEPAKVWPPGLANTVQGPTAGRPLKLTDPEFVRQFGCMMAPTIGAAGFTGELIKTVFELAEVQPVELLVTLKE